MVNKRLVSDLTRDINGKQAVVYIYSVMEIHFFASSAGIAGVTECKL